MPSLSRVSLNGTEIALSGHLFTTEVTENTEISSSIHVPGGFAVQTYHVVQCRLLILKFMLKRMQGILCSFILCICIDLR